MVLVLKSVMIRIVLPLFSVLVVSCSGSGNEDYSSIVVDTTENAAPVFNGPELDNMTFTLNRAIVSFIPAFTDSDSASLQYAKVGTWPLGLSIDVSTGRISGTPYELGIFSNLQITASDKTSTAKSNWFSIRVEQPPASGKFSVDVQADTQLADDQAMSARWQSDMLTIVTDAISPINRIVSLPAPVDVVVRNCASANAYFSPQLNTIVLCWELYWAAAIALDQRFDDPQTAVNFAAKAYKFILYHEVSHALDVQLDLPIAGNYESAADGIATVLSVEQFSKEGSLYPVLAALLFETDDGGSFGDVHPGSVDRAGDILCSAMGGDARLTSLEFFMPFVQLFADAGRDCVGEYTGRKSAVESWLPDLADLDSPVTAKTQAGRNPLTVETELMRNLADLLEHSGLYAKLSDRMSVSQSQ